MTTPEIMKQNSSCSTETYPTIDKTEAMIPQQELWECLVNSILLSGKNTSLWSFVNRTLRQFNINDIYSEVDVILETADIGRKKIKEGEIINNPGGYFRVVAYNVVRNLSQKEKRQKKIAQKLKHITESIHYPEYAISEEITENQVELLCKNWKKLSKLEQKILKLREIKDLSWEQIAKQLVADNDEVSDSRLVTRIRQKGYRALQKLRRNFNLN